MPLKYPFSAVVGCEYDPTTASGLDDMGLALVLSSISPEIGGVLVRGEKGTAKSTTVRGLAEVLPWITSATATGSPPTRTTRPRPRPTSSPAPVRS